MNNSITINFPHDFDLLNSQNFLSDKYFYKPHKKSNINITFYDSFDWRIFNAGLISYSVGKRIYLRLLDTEIIIADSGFQKRPVFIWDFPEGDLKNKLNAILGVRALINRGRIKLEESEGVFVNPDKKTVCNVLSRKIASPVNSKNPVQFHTVVLFPLRGYEKDCRTIKFELNNKALPDPVQDPLNIALQSVGIKAGDYSGKFSIRLKKHEPALKAIKKILKTLLNVIRQNEEGIINDIDTEFLHDLRVSVRRTRAALSQIPMVFPPNLVKKYKKNFAFIGKESNLLRDLDVYLLNEAMYKNMLPLTMRDSVSLLFMQLKEDRKTTHAHFKELLNSDRYKKIIDGWQDFLDSDTSKSIKNPRESGMPIIKIVKPIIRTQLDIVLALGGSITDETEDEKVHELRIECKKLRYLLEFFLSLFPKNKIEKFINHLKILQDNLGKFNDYSMQQMFLQNYIEKLPLGSFKNKQAIAAVGALIGVLNDRQSRIRQEFALHYAQFASKENLILSEKLFPK